jgi:hypothetical protein
VVVVDVVASVVSVVVTEVSVSVEGTVSVGFISHEARDAHMDKISKALTAFAAAPESLKPDFLFRLILFIAAIISRFL